MGACSNKLILKNANIITLHPFVPHVDWLAADNGKLVGIGMRDDWVEFEKPDSIVLDCGGKTVLAGFMDSHLHLLSHAKSFSEVNLRPGNNVLSIADLRSAISDHGKHKPPDTWIIGTGYNEFYLAEKRHPNRWDIDEATSKYPVMLTHRSGHAHVLNSLGLELVGISFETGDPEGGLIERDPTTGEPTGLLYEMGDFLSDRIPRMAPAALEMGVRMANEELLSAGITSVHDASARNGSDKWRLFESWKKDKILRPRTTMMLGYDAFERGEHKHFQANSIENQLRVGAVKIVLDYTTGRLHPPQSELNEMVLRIHREGMQAAIHAVQEQAIEAACDAVEYALAKEPMQYHRHRIEHCSVCPPTLALRIASLGVTVITQPPFIYYNGERYLQTVPAGELEHLYPFRTLLNYGVNLAASSDAPIVPPKPLIGIYSAVSRMSQKGGTVGRGQKIAAIDALRMYTQNAAKASFEENLKGSVTPGKLADLVVLSGDPTRGTPAELEALQVEMTIIGGEVVWAKEGWNSVA